MSWEVSDDIYPISSPKSQNSFFPKTSHETVEWAFVRLSNLSIFSLSLHKKFYSLNGSNHSFGYYASNSAGQKILPKLRLFMGFVSHWYYKLIYNYHNSKFTAWLLCSILVLSYLKSQYMFSWHHLLTSCLISSIHPIYIFQRSLTCLVPLLHWGPLLLV